MRILPPTADVALERAAYSRYSQRAVRNMYEAAAARLEALRLHRVKLECRLSMEYDLYELLNLAERLDRVDRNEQHLKVKVRRLREELLRRKLREVSEGVSAPRPRAQEADS